MILTKIQREVLGEILRGRGNQPDGYPMAYCGRRDAEKSVVAKELRDLGLIFHTDADSHPAGWYLTELGRRTHDAK